MAGLAPAPFAAMMKRLVPRGETLLLTLGAPVTLICAMHGHNGFLTALLLGPLTATAAECSAESGERRVTPLLKYLAAEKAVEMARRAIQIHGANGYLPNDRRHYIKGYGFYQLTPEWRFSATATFQSGRPKNCTGYYPNNSPEDEEFIELYSYGGPYYHFCNGEPVPRGTSGRLPWTNKLDLGVAYAPNWADNALEFSLDVFNVFDEQEAQSIVEYGELGGPGVPYAHSNRVLSYSTPRSVRFALRYDF